MFTAVYGRLRSKTTAKAIATMIATPIPIVYISYGGFVTVGVVVLVACGAATETTPVSAHELPYDVLPMNVAVIV